MRKAMTSGWPWSVDDDSHRVDGIGTVRTYRVIDARGDTVVEFSNSTCSEIVYEDDGEGGGSHYDVLAMANAELIASAPDIYNALTMLVSDLSNVSGPIPTHLQDDLNAAKSALAKARGEATT